MNEENNVPNLNCSAYCGQLPIVAIGHKVLVNVVLEHLVKWMLYVVASWEANG